MKDKSFKWIYPTKISGFAKCPLCGTLWRYIIVNFYDYCPTCQPRKEKWGLLRTIQHGKIC